MAQTLTKEEVWELKRLCVERLQGAVVPYGRMSQLDERLSLYVKACIDNPEGHNMYELLAVERFLRMMTLFELRDREAQRFFAFYEFIRFPGTQGMERYRLTPVQVFQFASILWFWDAERDKRIVTEALLFVPRKFSKTTSVASLAVYDLLFGEANAQAYVASNSYDQSQVCFGVIKEVLKGLDSKLKRFKINREQVYNLQRGRSSTARCLASKADKLDGLNASLVIVDEYAQADSDALKNVLTSSMGARRNPLTVIITTASEKQDTPFYELLTSYKEILRGERTENYSIFAHIFEPDPWDEEDSPETWRKVQPHLGVTIQEDFYPKSYATAQLTSGAMKEFRNKLLNLFARDERQEWIKRSLVEGQMVAESLERFAGCTTMCAVDLSVRDDFSVVTFCAYDSKRKLRGVPCPWHSYSYYFFPEGALRGHTNEELYRRWAAQGYLEICRGEVIDYDYIADFLMRIARSSGMKIMRIGYDRYKCLEFVNRIRNLGGGDYLVEVSQAYGAFTSCVDSFERVLYTGAVSFDPNPITAYCFENAVMDENNMGNKKPIKRQADQKIDGAVTNLMTFKLYNDYNIQI